MMMNRKLKKTMRESTINIALPILAATLVLLGSGCGDTEDARTTENQMESETIQTQRRSDTSVSPQRSERNDTGSVGYSGLEVEVIASDEEMRLTKTSPMQMRIVNTTEHPYKNVKLYWTFGGEATMTAEGSEKNAKNKVFEQKIGSLAPGTSKTVEAKANPRSTGSLELCVWVEGDRTRCVTMNVVQPSLELKRFYTRNGESLLDKDATVYACDDIGIGYVVRNNGSGTIQNLTFNEELPDGLKTTDGNSRFEREIGTLAAGEEKRLEVKLAQPAPGLYEGEAKISQGELSGYSDKGRLTVVRPEMSLSIDAPSAIEIGRSDIVTFNLENTGDVPAFDTVLTMNGFREHEVLNENLSSGTVDIGRINAGQTRQIRVRLSPSEAKRINGTVVVNAYCMADITKTSQLNVNGIPAIEVVAIDTSDPVVVGEEFAYEIVIRNEGNGKALDVMVSGKAPEGIEFIGIEQMDTRGTTDADNFRLRLPDLDPGMEVTFLVNAKATGAGNFQTMHLNVKVKGMDDDLNVGVKTTVRSQQ